MVKKSRKSLIYEFEKENFPCKKEWWCVEGFFNTSKNNNKWCFKSTLFQGIDREKKTWKANSISIINLNKDKIYVYNSVDDSSKLNSSKDFFNIKYDKSFIKGNYPSYEMSFFDKKNNINLSLEYNCLSTPYFVSKKISGGLLPWGFGFLSYGFIPRNKLKGIIEIDNTKFSFKGEGYFEHIWGDFSHLSLSSTKGSFNKTISSYVNLFGNWLHNQDTKIPNKIVFSTNNRPPGYDWFWAVLDNGWSIFFGNMMFFIMEGIGTGILILTKDGKKYNEFSNISFKYKKMKYFKKYDFFYPTELQILAKKGKEKFNLNIKSISSSFKDFKKSENQQSIYGYIITEVPCKIDGVYFDGCNKLKVEGISKMESHRLLKTNGNNSLELSYELSKNRIRFLTSLNSHYFRKKFDICLDISRNPKLVTNFKRL
ncbi:hypothetical protein AYK21_04670 [Thermoplasmatales archaeon SG8-52-2]|nr:MAG: hypothetical protein AYK21_04670 [Thermoplasmatales archaeon SG8-52-2]